MKAISFYGLCLLMITGLHAADLSSSRDLSLMQQTLTAKGQGQFRRFGFHVYDAKLWTHTSATNTVAVAPPYALQLTYFMNIKAKKIIDASIDEMQRQKKNQAFLPQWRQALAGVIPTVKKGDTITGVHDDNSAIFYLNGDYLGEINDNHFANAFFGIWLDEDTSDPTLRKKLLQQD